MNGVPLVDGIVIMTFLVVSWSQFTLSEYGAMVAFALVVFGVPAPESVVMLYGAVA